MEKGSGHSAVFLLHFELPTPNVWSVFIFFGFKIGAVWGVVGGFWPVGSPWWCLVLLRSVGEARGYGPGGPGGGRRGRVGVPLPMPLSHSFVLSSVVPGCAYGGRRAESPPR